MTTTLTLSFFLHLLFLFVLLSSSIFSTSRAYIPVSAIHVNIVETPKEIPRKRPVVKKSEKVVKVEEKKRKVEKRQEPVKKKEEVRSKKVEAKSKKQEVKIKKEEVKKEMPAAQAKIPEPEPVVKKEVAPAPKQEAAVQKPEVIEQKVVIEKKEALKPVEIDSAEQTREIQEAKLTTALPVISGPAVEAPDFKYDYYLGLIRNKVDSRWSQPIAYTQVKQTLIEFTIQRNGEIVGIGVAESSGDYYFDQTALRAIALSNPFPPLPRGYRENFIKIRYRFIFGERG